MPNCLTRRLSNSDNKTTAESNLRAQVFVRIAPKDCPGILGRRLAISGKDYKGQLSAGYGGAGRSLGKETQPDASLELPSPVVSLTAGLDLRNVDRSVTRTYTQLLLCARFPAALYPDPVIQLTRTGPKPAWTGCKPVVLCSMKGAAWTAQLNVEAGGWLAADSADMAQELGVSATAEATLQARLQARKLELKAEKNKVLATQFGARLETEIDALLIEDLKRHVVTWIKRKKGEKVDLTPGERALQTYLDQEDFKEAPAEWGGTPPGWFGRKWRSMTTSSAEYLIKQLEELGTEMARIGAYEDAKHAADIAIALRDRKQARDASKAEEAQKKADLKAARKAGKPNKVTPEATAPVLPEFLEAKTPSSTLRMTVVELQGQLAAGGVTDVAMRDGDLSNELTVNGDAHLAGMCKRVSCRFQLVGETAARRTVVYTQDCVFDHRLFMLSGGARLSQPLAEDMNYGDVFGTVTYRAVVAYWLAETGVAYPNGSGVCFGLSIAMARLNAYGAWCTNPEKAPQDAAMVKTEEFLSSKLHVEPAVLHKFFKDFHATTLGQETELSATSVLVEAGFGFVCTSAALTLPGDREQAAEVEREPLDFFKPASATDGSLARLAQARLSAAGAQVVPDAPLQSLRVRVPINQQTSTSRAVFPLGKLKSWRFRKTTEAGFQACYDLHSTFFPDLNAPDLHDTSEASKRLYDYAVPAVALFGDIG